MKRLCLFCLPALLLACTILPPLEPATDRALPLIKQACGMCFPSGKWQFLHAIEAETPGGGKVFLMGAMVLTAQPPQLECALMTPEGFVLFNAVYTDKLTVNRAVPPFDDPAFANGMISDIRLVFFPPDSATDSVGTLESGLPVCRHTLENGQTVDTIIRPDHTWEIRQYDSGADPARTILISDTIMEPDTQGRLVRLPKTLTLTAHGLLGYKLRLDLLEASALAVETE